MRPLRLTLSRTCRFRASIIAADNVTPRWQALSSRRRSCDSPEESLPISQMTRSLLDTSVASWVWDGGNSNHARARERLTQFGDAPLFVCAITVGEIEYGLKVSPAIDAARHLAVRTAMAGYEVLPIDHHTGRTFGEIRGTLFTQYAPRDTRGRITKKAPEDLIEPVTQVSGPESILRPLKFH